MRKVSDRSLSFGGTHTLPHHEAPKLRAQQHCSPCTPGVPGVHMKTLFLSPIGNESSPMLECVRGGLGGSWNFHHHLAARSSAPTPTCRVGETTGRGALPPLPALAGVPPYPARPRATRDQDPTPARTGRHPSPPSVSTGHTRPGSQPAWQRRGCIPPYLLRSGVWKTPNTQGSNENPSLHQEPRKPQLK